MQTLARTKTEILYLTYNFYTPTVFIDELTKDGGVKMKKNEDSYYIREYTLQDRTTKSIKIESWRSFKEEMRVLGITDSDFFQIQMKNRAKQKVIYCLLS